MLCAAGFEHAFGVEIYSEHNLFRNNIFLLLLLASHQHLQHEFPYMI
jgi:hypothetical protein